MGIAYYLDMDTPLIFFNLETTDGNTKECRILSIGAHYMDKRFYVEMKPSSLPNFEVSRYATNLNGFEYKEGELYRNSHHCRNAVSQTKGLLQFLMWIEERCKETGNSGILIAHGASKFHVPILIRLIQRYGLEEEFRRTVFATVDSLELA